MRNAARILSAGHFLSRALPRGKGAVVRSLGPLFVRDRSHFLVTRHGAKLVLSPDSMDVYSTMWGHHNAWDYDDFLICFDSIEDGGVFYDIGANVGYFSVEMTQLTKGCVKTVAFEPQDRLADAIRVSAEANGFGSQLLVMNLLVGDHNGMAPIYLAPATIHTSASADTNRQIKATSEKEMATIDSLVASGRIPPPTMFKMDIEGSEHLAFAGARETLRAHQPHIFIEYNQSDDPGGRVWAEVKSLAEDTGAYDIYFSPRTKIRARYPARLNRIRSEENLPHADGLFLRSKRRPLRDSKQFAEA